MNANEIEVHGESSPRKLRPRDLRMEATSVAQDTVSDELGEWSEGTNWEPNNDDLSDSDSDIEIQFFW